MIDNRAAGPAASKALLQGLRSAIYVIRYDNESVRCWEKGLSRAYFPDPADPLRSLERAAVALERGLRRRPVAPGLYVELPGLFGELEFAPVAIAMGAALRLASQRPPGWPPAAGRALAELRLLFNDWLDSWGSRDVVGPDAPLVVRDRLVRFRETYDRPIFQAVLSMIESGYGIDHFGCQLLFGPFWSEAGVALARALGYRATMTPDEVIHGLHQWMEPRCTAAAPVLGRSRPAGEAEDMERWRRSVQNLRDVAVELEAATLAPPRPTAAGGSQTEADSGPSSQSAGSTGKEPRQPRDQGFATRAVGELTAYFLAKAAGKTTDRPPTNKELAERIGCHESTVSRATKDLRALHQNAGLRGVPGGARDDEGSFEAWDRDTDD
jgi:hypothetical protein